MFDIVEEIRVGLAHLLWGALESSRRKKYDQGGPGSDFTVEVPREKEHGDFATNLAMLLAKPARMAPRKIAEILVQTLPRDLAWVEKIEIAGPGFINFYLQRDWVHQVIPRIIEKSENYGRVKLGNGQRVGGICQCQPYRAFTHGQRPGSGPWGQYCLHSDFAGYDVTGSFTLTTPGIKWKNSAFPWKPVTCSCSATRPRFPRTVTTARTLLTPPGVFSPGGGIVTWRPTPGAPQCPG